MIYTSRTMERMIDAFASLPTIGKKTAQRLTYFILRQDNDFVENFSSAMKELKQNIHFCSTCYNYTEADPCPVCTSHKRDKTTICVVEEPNDVTAIEKTGEYNGLYHVLHGRLNPLEDINPEDLKIKELVARLGNVKEIILALNTSVESEVTAQYLVRQISPLEIKITRIARGLPIGSDLEFADDATISRALDSRVEITE